MLGLWQTQKAYGAMIKFLYTCVILVLRDCLSSCVMWFQFSVISLLLCCSESGRIYYKLSLLCSFNGEQPADCVEAPPPYVGNVVVHGSDPV